MKDVFTQSKNNLTSTWRKSMEITKMSSRLLLTKLRA